MVRWENWEVWHCQDFLHHRLLLHRLSIYELFVGTEVGWVAGPWLPPPGTGAGEAASGGRDGFPFPLPGGLAGEPVG